MGVLVGMGWGVKHKVEWIIVRIGGVEARSREERRECTGFVGGDSSIHGGLLGVPYVQAFSDIQCWAAICSPSMSSLSRHLKKLATLHASWLHYVAHSPISSLTIFSGCV